MYNGSVPIYRSFTTNLNDDVSSGIPFWVLTNKPRNSSLDSGQWIGNGLPANLLSRHFTYVPGVKPSCCFIHRRLPLFHPTPYRSLELNIQIWVLPFRALPKNCSQHLLPQKCPFPSDGKYKFPLFIGSTASFEPFITIVVPISGSPLSLNHLSRQFGEYWGDELLCSALSL